jgi:hypothetical protein
VHTVRRPFPKNRGQALTNAVRFIAESINVTFMKIYKKRLLTRHAAFIYVYILNQNAVKNGGRYIPQSTVFLFPVI